MDIHRIGTIRDSNLGNVILSHILSKTNGDVVKNISSSGYFVFDYLKFIFTKFPISIFTFFILVCWGYLLYSKYKEQQKQNDETLVDFITYIVKNIVPSFMIVVCFSSCNI